MGKFEGGRNRSISAGSTSDSCLLYGVLFVLLTLPPFDYLNLKPMSQRGCYKAEIVVVERPA